MHPRDPRPLLTLVFALMAACHDQRSLGFIVDPHPPLAVGTTVPLALEPMGGSWAPSGGKTASLQVVKVTSPTDHACARGWPSSQTYIEVAAIAPGTCVLTIEGLVDGKRVTLKHPVTVVPAAAIAYKLAKAEAPMKPGAVLGRGITYPSDEPIITDASGERLAGAVGLEELYSATAGEVTLPAPPGVTPPKVRFADIELELEWRVAGDALVGSISGRADGQDVLSTSSFTAGSAVEVTTPKRCTITAAYSLDFYVQPVAGTTGPCRVALRLARETRGQYEDREIDVPILVLPAGA